MHSSTVLSSGQNNHQSPQDPRTSVEGTKQDLYTTSTTQMSQNRLGPPTGQFCFEDKCRCSGKTVDCSHNYGRLTYILKFSFSITSLVFSFNNLTAIPTDNFFQNMSWISCLNLSYNGLQHISPGAFVSMKSLRYLFLDHNNLAPRELQWVFMAKSLTTVLLGHTNLVSIPDEIFAGQLLRNLRRLDLSSNFIEHLNMTVFRHTPNLGRLQISHNRLLRLTPTFMPYLGRLQLNDNALYQFPHSCADNGPSLFPYLNTITFSDNKFSNFPEKEIMCFPSLTKLDMSRNPIRFLVKDMFGEKRFPVLSALSLQAIQHIDRIERFAFRNPSLEKLTLKYNNIPFGAVYVNADCFAGSQHLKNLQLSHNSFLDVQVMKFRQLFAALKSLQELYLNTCSIKGITEDSFKGLKNLSLLSLFGNRISDLPDSTFDFLVNLENLRLDNNQIQTVSEKAFSLATRNRLKHLDMSGNPFVCTCDLLWFQHWLVSSPSVFSKSYRAYTCSNLANTSVEAFSLTQQQCLWSRETYRAIIACGVVFITVVIMVSVVYHYRWHIRLMLAFRGRSEVLRRRLEEENFDYDVFVSFAGEDLDWVQQHLMAKLETELGLRLCIHERDFVPGKNILNNIVDSVKGSKKHLMVFSRHFTHSPWCQFELDLCLGHTLDYGDALIVTCLGDVVSRDLTSTMAAVLETTTYIQWRDNRDVVTSFWERVMLSLRDIMQGNNENIV